MRSLILVDDRKIRKQAFTQVDRLLKKLQRMEANLELFYECDQRLFNDWFDLTFREQKQKLASLQGEYRELAEFHNWMMALSQMADLSLPQAAVHLRDEERLYRDGSDQDRRNIDAARALRDEFIRTQGEREFRRAQRARSRDEAHEDVPRQTVPDPADIEELELLARLSDAEIADWCADSDVAFLLLGKALRVGAFCQNYRLFFRLWDSIHPGIQTQFATDFKKRTGVSLFTAIEKMRATVKVEDDEPAETESESATGAEVSEDAAPPVDFAKIETLKLTYRQLARKLHPDMNGTDSAATVDWRKKMWLRVQTAYKSKDTKELTKLFHLVLLRSRELNDLRLSELHLSHQWLEDEIEQTEEYVRNLRKQPAWGFSRRKDISTISSKLERQISKDSKTLAEQVVDLRIHHSFLERMGRADSRGKRRKSE